MGQIVIQAGVLWKDSISRTSVCPRPRAFLICIVIAASVVCWGQSSLLYGVDPGESRATIRGPQMVLENDILAMRWFMANGFVAGSELLVRSPEKSIPLSRDIFVLKLRDGKVLRSSAMKIKDPPRIEALSADLAAERSAQHFPGQQLVVRFDDPAEQLSVSWRATLRNGSNYVRQELSFHAFDRDSPIREVELFDFKEHAARVAGTVKGSPVTAGDAFFGFEHPLSACSVKDEQVRCSINRELPLRAGQTVTYSSVIGASPAGQMRRGFLNYTERERARPYRPFLHYNSWYDIGFNNSYDQAAALDVIHAFGSELVEKRGVHLDSFLFDDGWDDPHTLWSFGAGFPQGFTPLKAAAEKYGAEPGVWLSPWGGYDQAKEERLKYGRQHGLETNEGGFALSGPKYFARFREVTLKFIRDYGVNQFKIDGTGKCE